MDLFSVKYIYTVPILKIMSLDKRGAPTLNQSETRIKDLTCKERIKESLRSRGEDFERFITAYMGELSEEDESIIDEFYNYGLSIDMVSMGTFKDMKKPYLRYQLSWGGPSDEINFYQNGKIEYRFLDWFDGSSLDITGLEWAQWLRDYLIDVDLINDSAFLDAWEVE